MQTYAVKDGVEDAVFVDRFLEVVEEEKTLVSPTASSIILVS